MPGFFAFPGPVTDRISLASPAPYVLWMNEAIHPYRLRQNWVSAGAITLTIVSLVVLISAIVALFYVR